MEKDASPLTSANGASHDFLIESLRSLTPEVLVISEESEEAAGRFAASAGSFWLVDPLDGTKEFLLEDQRVYGKYRFD
jgi:3'(2'), 5'-bisphosphate nucleotidase